MSIHEQVERLDLTAGQRPSEEAAFGEGDRGASVWDELIRAWLATVQCKSGSANSVAAYRIACEQFLDWVHDSFGSIVMPWQVTGEMAERWAHWMATEAKVILDRKSGEVLRREPLAKTSINSKLSVMKGFFDFAQRCEALGEQIVALWPAYQRNPFDKVARARVSPEPSRAKSLTSVDLQRLMAAINIDCLTGQRDFALLNTLLATCRRPSEILHLRWGDLHELADGSVACTYGHARNKGELVLNKASYQTICTYLQSAGRPLATIQPGEYIFVPLNPERTKRLPNYNGKIIPNRPISSNLVNRILRKYARRAGIPAEKVDSRAFRRAAGRLRVEQTRQRLGAAEFSALEGLLVPEVSG